MISIDGNVYTGKTTLARSLANRLGIAFVREHNHFVRPTRGLDIWETHVAYIGAEIARKRSITDENCILDRSIISLGAHVWAMHRLGYDMRARFVDRMYEDEKGIAIPETRIFLFCDHGTIFARSRSAGAAQKATAPLLLTPDYLCAIDEFLRKLDSGGTLLNSIERALL